LDVSRLIQEDASKVDPNMGMSDEFVVEHRPMVEALAANISGSGKLPIGIEYDDLVSWGMEGLIKAYKNFDDSKGSQFKTYAYYRIRGEILDRIRKEWRYRNPNDYQEHKKRIQDRIAEVAEESLDNADPNQSTSETVNSLLSNAGVMCLMSIENIEIVADKEGMGDPEKEFIDNDKSVLWEEINSLEETEKKLVELF